MVYHSLFSLPPEPRQDRCQAGRRGQASAVASNPTAVRTDANAVSESEALEAGRGGHSAALGVGAEQG